jgi:hypothetical protein
LKENNEPATWGEMAKQEMTGELRAAFARLEHWLHELEIARASGDKGREERADGFVREYDEFIAVLKRRRSPLDQDQDSRELGRDDI